MKNEKHDELSLEQLGKITGGLAIDRVDASKLQDGGDSSAGNLSGDTIPTDPGDRLQKAEDGPVHT